MENPPPLVPRNFHPGVILLLAVFTGCGLFVATGSALTLVDNGKPAAVLVVPDEKLLVPQYAALEFQHHVKKAGGAVLPIVSETEAAALPGGKVYFGKTRALEKAGLGGEDFGKYGFAGRLKDGSLFFYGRDANIPLPDDIAPEELLLSKGSTFCWKKTIATLLAVHDFLDTELGARWILPGPSGEYVPKRATIAVENYDKHGTPRYISHHMLPFEEGALEQRQWLLRQRFLRLEPEGFITDHSFEDYWKDYHETHPDIFAMRPDGSRGLSPTQPGILATMCVSNPELVRLKIERWKNTGEKDAEGKSLNWRDGDITKGFINVHENDVDGYCACPACRAMDAPDPRFATHDYWGKGIIKPFLEGGRYLRGEKTNASETEPSLTDRYAKFYLAVQKEAEKIQPGVTVHAHAYLNFREPPKETKLNDRITINFVEVPFQFWRDEDTKKSLAAWDGWRASGVKLFLRPNLTYRGHNYPDIYVRRLGGLLSHFAQNGMVGSVWDGLLGQWATQGPNFYMIGRMLQHPEMTPDAILNEFYSAFGPAKEQVAAYFNYWDGMVSSVTPEEEARFRQDIKAKSLGGESPMVLSYVFTPDVMARGRELLDQATVAAAGDEEAKARVHILDLGLRDAELTLAAYDSYKKISRKDEASQKRFAEAVAKLEEFRNAHMGQYVNYGVGWMRQVENGMWGDALRQIQAKMDAKPITKNSP